MDPKEQDHQQAFPLRQTFKGERASTAARARLEDPRSMSDTQKPLLFFSGRRPWLSSDLVSVPRFWD